MAAQVTHNKVARLKDSQNPRWAFFCFFFVIDLRTVRKHIWLHVPQQQHSDRQPMAAKIMPPTFVWPMVTAVSELCAL
jgi:hypothetical protein